MGFTVDPGSVDGLGKLTHRQGAHLSTVVGLTKMDVMFGRGFFGMLDPLQWYYELLCRIAIDQTNKAASLGQASGTELQAGAKYYSDTDRERAAKLDDTLPDGGTPTKLNKVDRWGGGKPFAEVNPDPVGEAIRDYRRGPNIQRPGSEAFNENYGLKSLEVIKGIFDKAQFSAEITALLNQLVGRDIIGELGKLLNCGDWEVLDAQAIAFQQAALSVGAVQENIDKGRFDIQSKWEGNAAEAARGWLETYSNCLDKHASFLFEVSYRTVAFCHAMYLNLLELRSAVDLLIGKLLCLFPLGTPLDVATGIAKLLNGENSIVVLASIVASLTKVGDCVFAAEELVLVFHSSMARGRVLEPVDTADWPPEPYRVPKEMR